MAAAAQAETISLKVVNLNDWHWNNTDYKEAYNAETYTAEKRKQNDDNNNLGALKA